MVINHQNLNILRQGYKTNFQQGIESVTPLWQKIALKSPSTTSLENYGFLDGLTGMKEWIGERQFHALKERNCQIVNKTWSDGVTVPRTAVEDDKFGLYSNAFRMLGESSIEHPDQLVWELAINGFDDTNGLAWDGQYFFDADHLTWNKAGKETTFSNTGGGSGAAWFMADLSKTYMKPIIFQSRTSLELVAQDRNTDTSVFEQDDYRYGARARYNAGFGMFQLIHGSKATLDEAAVVSGRTNMMSQRKPSGAKLNINTNTLIVGPSNLQAALDIAQADRKANGQTNVWRGRFTVLEVPYLD
jgi:phage major head subunit gpT-like protein